MGRDLPLGRIAGIRVGMDWTVLLVAAYYTVVLHDNRYGLPETLSSGAYWIAAAAGALLFFLSLLAHEVGHALVARREGIGVEGISLWLLGGVAKLESSPRTPGAELRIAAVGPATSAACGLLFLGIGVVIGDHGAVGLAARMFEWLGFINLLLAALNMLPAAPLDGGSVLSALLWMKTRNAARATTIVAWLGVLLGGGLAASGFVQLQSGGDTSFAPGMLLVGLFILWSARRQLRSAPLRAALEGVVVADGMLPNPPVTSGAVSIDTFLRNLGPTTHQAYPVIGPDGQVSGVLTADAIRAVPSDRWAALRVDELALPLDRVVMVRPDDPLLQACQRIEGGPSSDGLVIDEWGRVVGTVGTDAIHTAIKARRQVPA